MTFNMKNLFNNKKSKDQKLFDAICNHDIEGLREALRRGANIEARNIAGFTPILYAAFCKEKEMVQLLWDAGADIRAVSSSGMNIIQCMVGASTSKNLMIDIAEKLIKAGVNVNHQDRSGKTALMDAADTSDREMIKLLMRNGADKDISYLKSKDKNIERATHTRAEDIAANRNYLDAYKLITGKDLYEPRRDI